MILDKITVALFIVFVISILFLAFIMWTDEHIKEISFGVSILGMFIFLLSLVLLSSFISRKNMFTDGVKVSTIISEDLELNSYLENELLSYLEEREYESYDYIQYTGDLSDFSFTDCVKLLSIRYATNKFFSNCELIDNTEVVIANGSEVKVVADVHKVYLPRGGYTYSESSYLRYNDIFYSLKIKKDDISSDKTYLIEYAKNAQGTIMDLTGDYVCYTDCRLYESKY